MWLLNAKTYELEEFGDEDKPKYAILSHTWDKNGELSFKDVWKHRHAGLQGWRKIESCCKQALIDGHPYVWVDTCCIDKRNQVELTEAINSMFRWYKGAAICYALLSDVAATGSHMQPLIGSSLVSENVDLERVDAPESVTGSPNDEARVEQPTTRPTITGSRWFSRSWTLQELLAPQSLLFYDSSWNPLGTRTDYALEIEKCIGISHDALSGFDPDKYCIAEKMAWAAGRRSTRPEDRAYSLLGILGVNLVLIPGEGGEQAFIRLQEILIDKRNDNSIFAWNKISSATQSHWLLAPSPDSFEGCHIYQDFRSCGTGAKLDKIALTGAFDTRIDCFDVECLCLGHFRACSEDSLPEHFRDSRGPLRRNAVGMLVVAQTSTNPVEYRRVNLDGKQCLLFDMHSQQGLKYIRLKQASILPVPAKALEISSWQSNNAQYPFRADNETIMQVTPGIFWTEDITATRFSQIVFRLDGKKVPERRVFLYPNPARNGPLMIQPGHERTDRCFVIRNPNSGYDGMVIHFWYDLTNRPTVRADYLLQGHGKSISQVYYPLAFQEVESTCGWIELSSRYIVDDPRNLTLDATTRWANSVLFDELVADDNTTSTSVPVGSRVVHLGDNIKIIFVPVDSGHRVLLSFRGRFENLRSFPREWLWPMPEPEAPPARAKSMASVKSITALKKLRSFLIA